MGKKSGNKSKQAVIKLFEDAVEEVIMKDMDCDFEHDKEFLRELVEDEHLKCIMISVAKRFAMKTLNHIEGNGHDNKKRRSVSK